jgi:2-phosphosulfolactate phosphatase
MTSLEVLFTPAEVAALAGRDLSGTYCVVFDVLRATTTMVTALANGAAAILPVEEIGDALAARPRWPEALLAGEREGVRIGPDLTGGLTFDLGNSPREFTHDCVAGRIIVMTTTNGTRALRGCAGAKTVLAGSFLNLEATARHIERVSPPALLLVCSGTLDQAAYEDVLGAGALCERLWTRYGGGGGADSAHIARRLYRAESADLVAAMAQSRNGRRLLAHPDLRDDVPFCLQRDTHALVAVLNADGLVRPARVAPQ